LTGILDLSGRVAVFRGLDAWVRPNTMGRSALIDLAQWAMKELDGDVVQT
jgi:hypothetical protein